ncbi:hypothetical protein [Kibdelosporangium phytohabitans]|uniref:Uncharacterized protein n=1 Tax=Kibdelosporangium phytohabitans TaxID=860235 RepID=A0A0N9I878_9PSEU|nr:hypothetical protein [Kibdelosporangium phytohabitans]ALG12080.1 hypothetical protein AOZ06_39085 [Kibdelosporangium phytohabitans]MBE1463569.1 hypothetical protein [Kibdelosporangium phytohabitans]
MFAGSAARMWDSTGAPVEQDLLAGNAEGLRSATMPVEVSDTAVSIRPDQAFLADPATTYPVHIDPGYRCTDRGKTDHMVVQSAWPDAKNFNRTDGKLNDLKAGYVCEQGTCFVSQTFLRMKTYQVAGRWVRSAYLHLHTDHSFHHCGGQGEEHCRVTVARAVGRAWTSMWWKRFAGAPTKAATTRLCC